MNTLLILELFLERIPNVKHRKFADRYTALPAYTYQYTTDNK